MADFQAPNPVEKRYQEMVEKLETERAHSVEEFKNLQMTYERLVGQADETVANRAKEVDAQFESRLERLDEMHARWKVIEGTIDRPITHLLAKKSLEEDPVYQAATDPAVKEAMETRMMTESEYWGLRIPTDIDHVQVEPVQVEAEKEVPPEVTALALESPPSEEVLAAQIVTVRSEIERLEKEDPEGTDLQRIRAAITAIERYAGKDIYRLELLTTKELQELSQGLQRYCKADSSKRLEAMSPYLHGYLDDWDGLDRLQRNTLRYRRRRDGKSAPGEYHSMTAEHERRLVGLIMTGYARMVRSNSMFRQSHQPNLNEPAAAFYVEHFLITSVAGRRDQILGKPIYDHLCRVLEHFDEVVKPLLTQFGQVCPVADIGMLYRFQNYWEKCKSLSVAQRQWAIDIFARYHGMLLGLRVTIENDPESVSPQKQLAGQTEEI